MKQTNSDIDGYLYKKKGNTGGISNVFSSNFTYRYFRLSYRDGVFAYGDKAGACPK